MNERIRELIEQAEKYALDNVGKGHYGIEDLIYQFQFADTKMEKFAELIVRECEKVISDGRYSDMACEGNSHRVSYNNGRFGASSDIKKHFGVEE